MKTSQKKVKPFLFVKQLAIFSVQLTICAFLSIVALASFQLQSYLLSNIFNVLLTLWVCFVLLYWVFFMLVELCKE